MERQTIGSPRPGEPLRRKSAGIVRKALASLLMAAALAATGCGKAPGAGRSSEKDVILKLVAAQVPYSRVTSLTFREGATHATARIWTDAKTRQQTGMGEDCVAELEKINGRWFLMQVNNWRD